MLRLLNRYFINYKMLLLMGFTINNCALNTTNVTRSVKMSNSRVVNGNFVVKGW